MPKPASAFPNRPNATVTADEIQEAIKNNSGHCMIADALRREYPDATRILVDVRTVRMTDPIRKKRYTWMTPYEAARFLVRWDQGIVPPEFHVRLRTPLAITESGAHDVNGRNANVQQKASRKVKGISKGTVIGGEPSAVGALAGKAAEKSRPPKPSRTRGFGIHAMNEIPEREGIFQS